MNAELEKKVRQIFSEDKANHGFDHADRTRNIANKLQLREGGDMEIIEAAVLLHDLHRVMKKENGEYCYPKETLTAARKILEGVKFPATKIELVLRCIELHEDRSFTREGKQKQAIEIQIVQDADNIDAMGAIGIARTFNFGGSNGIPLWIQNVDVNGFYDDAVTDNSTIHHFHEKLLKLKDDMNTQSAKEMAAERHRYMEEFINRFSKEWQGEL